MKKRVILFVTVTIASYAVNTCLFYFLEAGTNPNLRTFFDATWWWVVTSATVGYGDIYPVTTVGRVVAIFTILTGCFIYASMVALIAESVHSHIDRHARGTAPVAEKGHVVLCEYTAVTDEVVQALPSCRELTGRRVVIVSDLVSQNPYPEHLFVHGVPINPAVLQRANVPQADYVFIFSNLRFADPDVKSLHIASRVMKLNPHAQVLVEIQNTNSEYLRQSPERLLRISSRDLMESVIRNQTLDIDGVLAQARKNRTPSSTLPPARPA